MAQSTKQVDAVADGNKDLAVGSACEMMISLPEDKEKRELLK